MQRCNNISNQNSIDSISINTTSFTDYFGASTNLPKNKEMGLSEPLWKKKLMKAQLHSSSDICLFLLVSTASNIF